MQRRFKRGVWGGVLIALLVTAGAVKLFDDFDVSERPTSESGASSLPEETLQHAFENHRENFWIEATGQVTRLLPDDLEGSRHQRIIVELETGQTLLIAHNIDIAPRLDAVSTGDRLRFRGEYVWNPQGGVIHWTHRDPDGDRIGGWLELNGERIR